MPGRIAWLWVAFAVLLVIGIVLVFVQLLQLGSSSSDNEGAPNVPPPNQEVSNAPPPPPQPPPLKEEDPKYQPKDEADSSW